MNMPRSETRKSLESKDPTSRTSRRRKTAQYQKRENTQFAVRLLLGAAFIPELLEELQNSTSLLQLASAPNRWDREILTNKMSKWPTVERKEGILTLRILNSRHGQHPIVCVHVQEACFL